MDIVENLDFRVFGEVAARVIILLPRELLRRKTTAFAESGDLCTFPPKTLAIVGEARYNLPSIVL